MNPRDTRTPKDTRLARADAASLDEDELFWALMEPAWGSADEGTRGQRVLACVTYFIRDVENGGLEQALWNREAEEVDEVLADFDLLGASDDAAAVRAAIRALFGERPPADLEKRRDLIDARDQDWLDEHVHPLSRALDYETRLYPHFRRYIEAHSDEFYRD